MKLYLKLYYHSLRNIKVSTIIQISRKIKSSKNIITQSNNIVNLDAWYYLHILCNISPRANEDEILGVSPQFCNVVLHGTVARYIATLHTGGVCKRNTEKRFRNDEQEENKENVTVDMTLSGYRSLFFLAERAQPARIFW